jgi:hypothetical protein
MFPVASLFFNLLTSPQTSTWALWHSIFHEVPVILRLWENPKGANFELVNILWMSPEHEQGWILASCIIMPFESLTYFCSSIPRKPSISSWKNYDEQFMCTDNVQVLLCPWLFHCDWFVKPFCPFEGCCPRVHLLLISPKIKVMDNNPSTFQLFFPGIVISS